MNEKEINKQIGENIKTAREKAGMNQDKAGEAVGISFQQWQKYEKGTNRISAAKLAMFASATGISVLDILPDTGVESEAQNSVAHNDYVAAFVNMLAIRILESDEDFDESIYELLAAAHQSIATATISPDDFTSMLARALHAILMACALKRQNVGDELTSII